MAPKLVAILFALMFQNCHSHRLAEMLEVGSEAEDSSSEAVSVAHSTIINDSHLTHTEEQQGIPFECCRAASFEFNDAESVTVMLDDAKLKDLMLDAALKVTKSKHGVKGDFFVREVDGERAGMREEVRVIAAQYYGLTEIRPRRTEQWWEVDPMPSCATACEVKFSPLTFRSSCGAQGSEGSHNDQTLDCGTCVTRLMSSKTVELQLGKISYTFKYPYFNCG